MTVSIGAGGGLVEDGEDTTVTNSDGITAIARGGSAGDDWIGGSGWSGGGDAGGGAGGYNGGNGKSKSWIGGGKGQHTSLPTVDGVQIVEGDGGQSCSGCFGGGGGGILINGYGRRGDGRAAQGFGSGGGEFDDIGKSGVVILYV